MKIQIKKIVHLSGYYTIETTEVISAITSLCRKYKISIDDINMTVCDQEKYYAMISSFYFPKEEHIFWNELYQLAGVHDANIILENKEDY